MQPIVALGMGLRDAGYSVRIVTLDSFKDMVLDNGLDFWPVRGDAQQIVQEMMVRHGANTNFLQMYKGVMRSFGGIVDDYIEAFSNEALQDSDAILSQLPGNFFGYDMAEALGVPYIALSVIPQERTAAYPIALLPNRFSPGRWWNRLSYGIATQLAWRPFYGPINRFRGQLGLMKTPFLWGNTRKDVPVLQGFSEHVVPTEAEWGERVRTTGYWVLDEPEWEPSPELTQFLEAGSPPIYIGFGSMPVPDPRQTTQLILKALAESKQRTVLSAGWARLGREELPEHIFLLDYAPHSWLFPKMGGIVHHGGTGTTGAALRSGVPSVVIPFTVDQPFWSERSRALGVGPAPIPFQKLTATKLAKTIRQLLKDESMRKNAVQLCDRMAAEDGVGKAVGIIQDMLNKANK